MQRRLLAVQPVQVAQPEPDSGMRRLSRIVPLERVIVVPLPPLPEFAAHEKQLLAGLSIHPAIEQAQVGELLPVVAGHPAQQRSLAVYDLVVRERQHEILGKRVKAAESQVLV